MRYTYIMSNVHSMKNMKSSGKYDRIKVMWNVIELLEFINI